jgi:hypothetical protein
MRKSKIINYNTRRFKPVILSSVLLYIFLNGRKKGTSHLNLYPDSNAILITHTFVFRLAFIFLLYFSIEFCYWRNGSLDLEHILRLIKISFYCIALRFHPIFFFLLDEFRFLFEVT